MNEGAEDFLTRTVFGGAAESAEGKALRGSSSPAQTAFHDTEKR